MALLHCDFFSDALQLSCSMDVILPQAAKARRFATLYLLHGLSDDHTIWQRRTSIERYVADTPLAVVMPAVVNAVVWTFMYHQDGVVNTILSWFGVDPIPWLRSSTWALWAVIIIGIWRATPYYMVIFLAGLQAIPHEYYEAAQIDGADGWRQFRHITLPLLRPTTLLVMVMSVIVAMKVFAVPLIMTGGGPADATRVLPLFIYQTAFEFFKMGRAAAMSVFLFAAVMVFTLFQIRLFSRGED